MTLSRGDAGNGRPGAVVLYVGISDAPAWLVAQANTCSLRGWLTATQIECQI